MFYFHHRDDAYTELLAQLEFGEADRDSWTEVSGNPLMQRVEAEYLQFGERWLLLEKETGAWCFLEDNEFSVYRGFPEDRVQDVLRRLPSPSEGEYEEFFARLYRLGLLALDGRRFYDPEVFSQGPICNGQSFFTVKLTERCNLECGYCSANACSAQGRGGVRADMDWGTLKRTIDLVLGYPSSSAFILFIGGEPLLALDLMEKGVTYASECAQRIGKTISYGVQTNATLLSDGTLARLERLGVGFGVSLDGDALANDQSRTFPRNVSANEAIVRGLRSALGRGHSFGVICVVSRANYQRLPEIAEYFVSLGLKNVKLNPVSRLGRASTAWDRLALTPDEYLEAHGAYLDHVAANRLPILEENTRHMIHNMASRMQHYMCLRAQCGAGNGYFAFSPAGEIFPCDRFIGDKRLSLGQLSQKGGLEGLNEENVVMRQVDQRWSDGIAACTECVYKRLCAAGCSLDTFSASGRMDVAHPWCDYYRGIYRKLFELFAGAPDLVEYFCPETVRSYERRFFAER